MSTPHVSVHIPSPSAALPAARQSSLVRLAKKILQHEKRTSSKVSIILGDDALLHGLNRKYRKKDRPTDVLSFGLYKDEATGTESGDIYISLPRTRAQAEEYRTGFNHELSRLIVHGIYHLCGYDHHTPRELAEMDRKTQPWLPEAAERR